jgi:hypothetical protein
VENFCRPSGAPEVHVDGARRADLHSEHQPHASLRGGRGLSRPIGVECAMTMTATAAQGWRGASSTTARPSLPRPRVAETQAAVWALKEAGLKLHGGGYSSPGSAAYESSRSSRRVADPPCKSRYIACPTRRLRWRARKPGRSRGLGARRRNELSAAA